MKRLAVLSCASLLLAGCSGGAGDDELIQELEDSIQRIADAVIEELQNTDTTEPEPEPRPGDDGTLLTGYGIRVPPDLGQHDDTLYAEAGSDTVANLLPDPGNSFRPLSVTISRFFDDPQSTQHPDPDVAYVSYFGADDAGTLRVIFDTDDHQFNSHFSLKSWNELYSSFQLYSTDTSGVSLWSIYPDSRSGPQYLFSGSSEFSYLDVNGWLVWTDDWWHEGVMAYGVRTAPENLPLGTASYRGTSYMSRYYADDPNYSTGRVDIYGDLTLDVDFGQSKIAGQMEEFRVWAGGEETTLSSDKKVAISDGSIVKGRLSAKLEGTVSAESVSGFSGIMVGEFYGPAAEEVGGVIGGVQDATATSAQLNLMGYFGAKMEAE